MQTKSTTYKQCEQNSHDFAKKFWLLSWIPKRFEEIDAHDEPEFVSPLTTLALLRWCA